MANDRAFDLGLLRVFDALISERSVSAAAVRLGLSQPSISNALTKMRALHGDPLFVRTRQGMVPTPYAESLAEPIQRGLALIRSGLEQNRRFDPATSDRRFTVLMNDLGQAVILARLLPQLRLIAPKVDIRVMELAVAEYQRALEDGIADLAIGSLPTLTAGFYQQVLFTANYVVACRTDHPLREPLSLEAYLAAAHLRIRPPGVAGGGAVERLAAERGWQRRIALEVSHFLVLARLLPETDLIATVPHRLIDLLGDRSGIRRMAPPFELPEIRIQQCWHLRHHADAGNRWLRGLLASLFVAG